MRSSINAMIMAKSVFLTLMSLALATFGCAWVSLSPEGESVRVAEAAHGSCERRGKTTSTVADKVVFVRRSESKVSEELTRLARNEAAEMGADTVVPESAVEDGRQVFGIYQCGAASLSSAR